MIYEFFIDGPLPGLNEIIQAAKKPIPRLCNKRKKIKVFEYSQMKNRWTAVVMCVVSHKNIPAMESIAIGFIWLEKNRKRDPDNITAGAKFILDGLVKTGVIKNDGWQQIKKISHRFDVNKTKPGVIVKIMDANQLKIKTEISKCPYCNVALFKIPITANDTKIYSKWVCRNCGREF